MVRQLSKLLTLSCTYFLRNDWIRIAPPHSRTNRLATCLFSAGKEESRPELAIAEESPLCTAIFSPDEMKK
jgi:hypothetical protein